jgi:hypothetical protein
MDGYWKGTGLLLRTGKNQLRVSEIVRNSFAPILLFGVSPVIVGVWLHQV